MTYFYDVLRKKFAALFGAMNMLISGRLVSAVFMPVDGQFPFWRDNINVFVFPGKRGRVIIPVIGRPQAFVS
jgi:hypothetical protein